MNFKLTYSCIKNTFTQLVIIIFGFIIVMTILLNFVEIERIPLMADFFVKVLASVLSYKN
jgi:hypothetical protein